VLLRCVHIARRDVREQILHHGNGPILDRGEVRILRWVFGSVQLTVEPTRYILWSMLKVLFQALEAFEAQLGAQTLEFYILKDMERVGGGRVGANLSPGVGGMGMGMGEMGR